MGVTVSCDKIVSVKDYLNLQSGNTISIKMCVMDVVCHPGIILIFNGRSTIQRVCLVDVYLCVPFH